MTWILADGLRVTEAKRLKPNFLRGAGCGEGQGPCGGRASERYLMV